MDRPTVTIKQAMVIAGVSRRTIDFWLKDNRVQYVRTAGVGIRIYRDTLQRFGNVAPTKETAE